MPFLDGFEMLGFALDAEREDRLFLRWVALYQSQMGFEEFKQKAYGGSRPQEGISQVEADERNVVDVLKMVKEIIG